MPCTFGVPPTPAKAAHLKLVKIGGFFELNFLCKMTKKISHLPLDSPTPICYNSVIRERGAYYDQDYDVSQQRMALCGGSHRLLRKL